MAGVAELRGAGGQPCGNHKTGREVRRGHGRALPFDTLISLGHRPCIAFILHRSKWDAHERQTHEIETRHGLSSSMPRQDLLPNRSAGGQRVQRIVPPSLCITVHPPRTLPPLDPVRPRCGKSPAGLNTYPYRPGADERILTGLPFSSS